MASFSQNSPHIALVCTGGTIASTRGLTDSLVPSVTGRELVQAASACFDSAADDRILPDLVIDDTLQLDSSSIGLRELDTLLHTLHSHAARSRTQAIVVTHGTDSMEESAFAAHLFRASLPSPVPIVFTGAQRPFDHPASDGPANLAGAMQRAADLARLELSSVEIHFSGQNFSGANVFKQHTQDLSAFAALADYPQPAPAQSWPSLPRELVELSGLSVPIIAAYPGADSHLLDCALAAKMPPNGLVIEALGSGNMSTQMGDAVARALGDGIPVVIATRVPHGPVELAYGGAGGGATLADLGAIPASRLHPSTARIALLTAIATSADPAALIDAVSPAKS